MNRMDPVRLTPEAQILAVIRGISEKTEVSIEVMNGQPCRYVCQGPLFQYPVQIDLIFSDEGTLDNYSVLEKELLRTFILIDFGRVTIIVKEGKIVETGNPSWSRKIKEEKIPLCRVGGHVRYMLGGLKEECREK